MEEHPTIGKITVATDVLETIVRLTTLAVPGVVRMTPPIGIQRFLGKENGLRVLISAGVVKIDLHIVADAEHNLRTLGQQVQTEVTRAIQDMVGMEVTAVNVYVEDVAPSLTN